MADTFRLVDKANQPEGVKLKVEANFMTNGILNGGLLAPSAALLGEYAITTAMQDYFFLQTTATLRLSGLDYPKLWLHLIRGL